MNKINMDSNIAGRVLGVLGNDIPWYKYLQNPIMAPGALIPLGLEFVKSRQIAKDIAKYNKNLPQDQKLDSRNNDKYFHQRGMYQAASSGVWSALFAALAGELRELNDARLLRKDGVPEHAIQAERQKDLQNNYDAIIMALQGTDPVDRVVIPNPTIISIQEKKKNGEI